MTKTTPARFILYLIVFIIRVLAIALLVPLTLSLILNYAETDNRFKYTVMLVIADLIILIACHPLWKEMKDKTPMDSEGKSALLLKSPETPTQVRKAIHAFQMGTHTLDDAIIVAPYNIYYDEIYEMLKKQNFSFVKKQSKTDFIPFELEDFLQSLQEVRSGDLSAEKAIVALSYELLTPAEVIGILKENNEDYPAIIKELSSPTFQEDFSCEDMLDLLNDEQKRSTAKKS